MYVLILNILDSTNMNGIIGKIVSKFQKYAPAKVSKTKGRPLTILTPDPAMVELALNIYLFNYLE